MSNARRAAVLALIRQEQGGYSNLILDSILRKESLSPQDRAFASSLFYGTIERQITLDYRLNPFLKKPIERLDAPIRMVLRTGLYQASYMQVPVSAAVNEAVKLTKGLGKTSASGMVNAVLRRAIQAELKTDGFQDETERLSVLYSVGREIVAALLREYGAETEEILAAFLKKNPNAIRVNTTKCSVEELKKLFIQKGVEASDAPVENALLICGHGNPADTEAFRRGLFQVQGLPSQLAALSVGAKQGERVLDLCAAPGGKSAVLAQCMENTGSLISCDLAENRVPLIRRNLERQGLTNAAVMQNDGTVYRPEFADADRVLCDVPCSGLGIMGKKPDIRYKKMAEMKQLPVVQWAILQTASRYVKPGGRLVYSTCTILSEENQNQIQNFLAQNSSFHLLAQPTLPGVCDTGFGSLFLPDRTGLDGFFIAVMERD